MIHRGFCGVAIFAAFLAAGIEASGPVSTEPRAFEEAQAPRPGRSGPAIGRGGGLVQTPPTTVPDLSGYTEQEARDLLAKARLRVGDVTQAESGIKPGTVLKQTHTPGSQVAVGTPVGFAIATPHRGLQVWTIRGGAAIGRGGRVVQTPPTTVPDLSGYTEQEARGLLAKARLSAGDVTKVEADIKPGTVLKQTHTPGSQVAVGTPVGFAIAIPITVIVPDVVGSTERDASATLNKARLRTGAVRSEPSRSPPGRVLAQGPKAGDRFPVGWAVDLVIARPID